MFHNRLLNNKINKLHERYLGIIYNNKKSNFEELLVKDNSLSIHHKNVQTLAIKMHKFANNMSPEITNEIFPLREINHYNLKHPSLFILPAMHIIYNGTESAVYLGPRNWEIMPSEIKT